MKHERSCNHYPARSSVRVLSALLLVLALTTPHVFAQDGDSATAAGEVSMRPGTVDAGLSGGLGAFVYPFLEPQVGARVFFNDEIRWFAFGEARYLLEFGFQSQTVEVDGQTYKVTEEEFAGGGTSVNLGIGLRL